MIKRVEMFYVGTKGFLYDVASLFPHGNFLSLKGIEKEMEIGRDPNGF